MYKMGQKLNWVSLVTFWPYTSLPNPLFLLACKEQFSWAALPWRICSMLALYFYLFVSFIYNVPSWRCSYYILSFTLGIFVLWDKPWLWDIKQCWVGYPLEQVNIFFFLNDKKVVFKSSDCIVIFYNCFVCRASPMMCGGITWFLCHSTIPFVYLNSSMWKGKISGKCSFITLQL